jgi:hypothetical protein
MNINDRKIVEKFGLQEKPVLVVGIVKNIEKTLKKDIQNISTALEFFKEVHWFLVQSDSTDKSEQILSEIKKININFKYLSIDIPENSYSFRTERLAIGRNKYLSYIRENIDPIQFPYIVIADFNLLNNKLSSEAVLSSWSRDDWDVVTANQSGRYYDIWALRHPLWSPNDCWEQHEFLKKYIKIPEIVNAYSIKSRMLRIPKGSDWIPVESAFGGFAIYKSNFLMHSFFYEGKTEAGNMVCEHVNFNKNIKDSGARIFINTSLINTKYTDHSRRITLVFTFMRILRYLNVTKIKSKLSIKNK